jgi:phosphoenolpyruvate carboxylase
MARLLQSGNYIGIIHEMDNDISFMAKKTLMEKIGEIKDTMHTLAARFDLEREQRSVSRQLFARLTYDWTTLEEIKTRHLKGYGSVAEGLKDTLDPELDSIIALIREMERLVQNNK